MWSFILLIVSVSVFVLVPLPLSFRTCPAAVISEKYIITNADCADVVNWRPKIVRAELRLGIDGWSLFRGDTPVHRRDLDHTFQVKLQSVLDENDEHNFGLLEIIGNPSLPFGTVKLLNRNVEKDEPLFDVYPNGWRFRSDCRVISPSSDKPGQFTYTCGNSPPDQLFSSWSGETFMLAKEGDGYGLIGMPRFKEQPSSSYLHASSVKAFIAGLMHHR